jgi:DNA-binding CsgD family transcriptional regulator
MASSPSTLNSAFRDARPRTIGPRNRAQFEGGVDQLCRRGLDGRALLRGLAGHLRAALPCQGLLLLRTDPTTVLPTDGVVDALPPALCRHFWDNELLEPDYNKFVDLARREVTAATLSQATGAELSRSRRYADLYRPLGYGDELRVSFTARDGSCWGIAQLVRAEGEVFSEDERDLLAAVSPTVAEGLRAAFAVDGAAPRSADTGPALVLLDDAGDVQAVTAEARHWLAELVRGSATGMGPVPEPVYAVAGRARAAAAGVDNEPAWAQVRTADGVWLHLRAAHVEGSDPLHGSVAVVITPARAPDLAPLIALAYRVTAREQEVLQFVARGLTTAEMAQRLGISQHTVRDHIKALFSKVGVRSRTELVARVFAEHYFERLTAEADVLNGDGLTVK